MVIMCVHSEFCLVLDAQLHSLREKYQSIGHDWNKKCIGPVKILEIQQETNR